MPITKPKYDSASLTNLVDADPTPWKLYALLGVLVFVGAVAAAAVYAWHTQDLAEKENQACQALYAAKSPAAKAKVADDFPATTTAPRALILAAQDDYDAGKFNDALILEQQILLNYSGSPLKESAELGEAACYEQNGKLDESLRIYLEIARRRSASPYSGLAWYQAVMICEAKKDVIMEGQILNEALSIISPSSQFHAKLLQIDTRLKTNPPDVAPDSIRGVESAIEPMPLTPSPSPSVGGPKSATPSSPSAAPSAPHVSPAAHSAPSAAVPPSSSKK